MTEYKEQNTYTDWFSKAKYGVDGPAPAIGLKPGKTFSQAINEYDAMGAAKFAQDVGAAYMLINANQNRQYFIAPNTTFNNYTGYAPGEACAERDTIKDIYDALNPQGIKLILYVVGDCGSNDPQSASGLGWDGTANPLYLSRLCDIYREWSNRYGSMIAGWWVDGCYDWYCYNETNLVDLANALKAGNPGAVVCFNKGLGMPACFARPSCAADYTAGELNGLDNPCVDRWMNGLQWHHYLPLGLTYCSSSCKFTDKELINYIKACNKNGGVVTFSTGATGAMHPVDTAQYNQLVNLKKAIRDGINALEEQYYVDETNASVTYSGTWECRENPNDYGGTDNSSSIQGSYAEFAFSGTTVKWISASYDSSGCADIYIDGEFETVVDLWNDNVSWALNPENIVVYTKTGLVDGQHTIKIVVKGMKNERSSGYGVTIDGFIYANGTLMTGL